MKPVSVTPDPAIAHIIADFQNRSGLRDVEYEIKQRSDGQALIFKLANPTERFYKVLKMILDAQPVDQTPTPTINKRSPASRLQCPETKFFLRTLSESLNINRFSFKEEFFDRYTKSVSNAEAQITAAANHVVYGRRGSGKSSLLLYALRSRENDGLQSAWVDIQAYEKRGDSKVVLDIISETLEQLAVELSISPTYSSVKNRLARMRDDANLTDDQIREFLPDVRKVFSVASGNVMIFLDDFHLIEAALQPKLLGFLYAIARGNNVFLKISSIETLTKLWDAKSRTGLQVPNDAQLIKLDYNLTMPDKAEAHIEGILDAHAVYCGLPSVRFLCVGKQVLSRLVWVSAGVPRDALNMFAQAITKAMTGGRRLVSVTDVNMAASEMVSQKVRDVESDILDKSVENDLQTVLETVKEFCIKTKRTNAFLSNS